MPDFKCLHALIYGFVLLSCPPAWATSTSSSSTSSSFSGTAIGPETSTLRAEVAADAESETASAARSEYATRSRPEFAPDAGADDASGIQTLEWSDSGALASGVPQPPQTGIDVWQRIRGGFKFSEIENPLTAVHERWYAERPDYVKRMLERSRRYLFHIASEVERRGMPMEIALLPMIESAFNPKAYSTSDASGIWQFIASTGRHYGLKQDNWYDGRRDITAATNAALDYLGKLYLDFGDWQLALAAYNCGEGCVARAIKKNAQLGLPTDYASLALSTETRHYVPKLLAIKHLVLDPERFGIALDVLPNEPYFAQVEMRTSMDVRSAARLAGMEMDDFTALNPAFSRNLIRSDTPINILVPVDKTDHFARNLKNGVWDTWKPYHAKKGERLSTLAKRFGTTIARLQDHNSFSLKRGKLTRNQTILIPVKGRGVETDATEDLAESKDASALHIVNKGETLFALARRYGTTVGVLKRANPNVSDKLVAGQALRVPGSAASTGSEASLIKAVYVQKGPGKRARNSYTVRRGDTLSAIAARLEVSVRQLKSWNPSLRKSNRIQVGKRLSLH